MALPRRSAELRASVRDGAALVERIADGDESAFATLYDTTCGLVYGLLLRILGNSAAAEQVMVVIYQEVWERAASYDGREKPMTWLITTAHRRAVSRLRADRCGHHCQPSLELAGRALMTRPETDGVAVGEQRFAQSAFAELSTAQQQVIELAYFSGLRRDEIAAQLGLPLWSVQAEMRAGLMRLRDALESQQLPPA